MKTVVRSVAVTLLAGVAAMGAARQPDNGQSAIAVEKAVSWLAHVQGTDGGWGQDGGEKTFVRTGERLETQGNDVANTALAVLALVRAGSTSSSGAYQAHVRKGLEFLLASVERAPDDGLAITPRTGTQIQRKLGPFIDTFLTSMLLSELDGNMGGAAGNQRVRLALDKCVRKVEKNQQSDGSWNIAGGWAPILGTSIASRSLYAAQSKGVKVEPATMARVREYTRRSAQPAGVAGGVPVEVAASSAGVALYAGAQQLEQLSRSDDDRVKNAKEIRAVADKISRPEFVRGFGSMGGEEFFSYLNISDSMKRTGGPEWTKWNNQIKSTLADLQNQDGTWAGHHCITGRVAVTSAAVLTLLAERQAGPVATPAAALSKKR